MIDRKAIVGQLIQEQKDLEKLIQETRERLLTAPEGSVRVAKHGKGLQFYYRKESGERTGEYL